MPFRIDLQNKLRLTVLRKPAPTLARMHRHADDIAATIQCELLEVVLEDHARIASKDPSTHRHLVGGYRQTHHGLRGIVAAVPRRSALARHPTVAVVCNRAVPRFVKMGYEAKARPELAAIANIAGSAGKWNPRSPNTSTITASTRKSIALYQYM